MIQGSCHCGAVKLQIDADIPKTLTSCNCSICHRYGSLMAYFPPDKIQVLAAADATQSYSHGDKSIAFIRCATCGCFCHWKSLDPNFTDRMGVNARLFENVNLSDLQIRRFDGAVTWKFID
jgi:hypothetical protein